MDIMGVDIGTSSCKAIVFNPTGEILGSSYKELVITYPRPNWAEQEPEQVWHSALEVMSAAVAASHSKDIGVISISVQGDAVIPLNKQGQSLRPALLGMDYRSYGQAEAIANLIGGERLFQITGMRSHPMNSLTKIMWVKENEPEVYAGTWKFATYADFFLLRLCGVAAIDYSMASRTMAFDLKECSWSATVLKAVDIDPILFSEAVPSSTIVGRILPQVADRIGVSPKVIVAAGSHDQTCAALGAGIIEENLALDSHGTAEVISTTFSRPLLNESMYNGFYPCYYHVVPGMFFTFALNHTAGIVMQWYRDQFAAVEAEEAKAQERNAYDHIIAKTPSGPSPVMMLPHFHGSGTPSCDRWSRGAVAGLSLSTTRHDLAKAIMESQVYEMKINLETMAEAGLGIHSLRCVGGAAQSSAWLQLKADITGCSVATLRTREAACLGAALLAGTAAGIYNTLQEAVGVTVGLDKEYWPDPRMQEKYQELFELYRELYPALQSFHARLVQLNEKWGR